MPWEGVVLTADRYVGGVAARSIEKLASGRA